MTDKIKTIIAILSLFLLKPSTPQETSTTTKNDGGVTTTTTTGGGNSNPNPSQTSSNINPCTPKHCAHCHPFPSKHCTKCTNGFHIDKSPQPSCTIPTNVPNCRTGSLFDPSNPNICSECQKGYRLLSSSECIKDDTIHNCDWPFWHEDRVYCKGCQGMFLKTDFTQCVSTTHTDKKFPENCLYGGREDIGNCFMCEIGYDLTSDKMACIRSKVQGCKEFRNGDPYFCLQCDTDRGYYAVEVVQIGSDFNQICENFSFKMRLFLGVFLALVLFNFYE